MRVAVLDLASSSFHLLVADVESDGHLTRVLTERIRSDVARELAGRRRMPTEAIAAVHQVVTRLGSLVAASGADRTLMVATAACRDALNEADVLTTLVEAAGRRLEFLDAEARSRFALTGMLAAFGALGDAFVGIDLSGGKLDLVRRDRHGEVRASLDVGVEGTGAAVTAHGALRNDAVREIADAFARRSAGTGVFDEDIVGALVGGGWSRAVARAAAGRRWGALPLSINGLEVDRGELEDLAAHLAAVPPTRRRSLPGVPRDRASHLPIAAAIMAGLAVHVPGERLRFSEWGVREGLALRAAEGASSAPRSRQRLRGWSVERLQRAWSHDLEHDRRVGRISMDLLEALRGRLQLDTDTRELVGHAALLHGIGEGIAGFDREKHGAYLVEQAGLRGFAPEEVAIIATMVRFHAGGRPKRSFGPYVRVVSERRPQVVAGVAVLRLADALDRAGTRAVAELEITDLGDTILMEVHGDDAGACLSAGDCVSLLEEAVGVPIQIVGVAPEPAADPHEVAPA